MLHLSRKLLSIELRILKYYIKGNLILWSIFIFWIISIIAKAFLNFNMLVPCPIKMTLGIDCLGCGLNRSFVSLLRLDVSSAIEHNFLIIIIFPSMILWLIYDYGFYRKYLK